MLKIDVINDAYSQLRISGLTSIPTPEELETALSRMESMMAEWASRNICTNYNLEDSPDPNSVTGLAMAYKQAVSTNLAVRLMPDFNKAPHPILIAQASQSLANISAISARSLVRQIRYPSRQPRGSGNSIRYNRWRRFYHEEESAEISCQTNPLAIGDIDDFTEHFDDYLNAGEVISGFTLDSTTGIIVSNQSNTDNDVFYRVEARDTTTGNLQTVTIVVTTDSGRVQTRLIQFDVH